MVVGIVTGVPNCGTTPIMDPPDRANMSEERNPPATRALDP